LPLRIKPVRLKQSIYLRIPNDIADLIEVDPDDEITMRIDEQDGQFLLIYSVKKSHSKPAGLSASSQRPRRLKSSIRSETVKDQRLGGF